MRVVFVYAALISALIWLAVADSGDDNDDDDADDFVDDEGNFDLSKWQQHMQPCDNFDDDDAWVKCMNERQPFMKVHKAPREYLAGALPPNEVPMREMVATTEPAAAAIELPPSFDIRDRWPECQSIFGHIRNQPCNNCWAYSSSSAMSDRICIASRGKTKVLLSAHDLTTCCNRCQAKSKNCWKGGYPEKAFKHWVEHGIVTEQCKPAHKFRKNTDQTCVKQCKNPQKPHAKALHYGSSYITMNNAAKIQQEIYANGSVEAMFVLHKDLYKYQGGVYIPSENNTSKSYHSVRLIGWGEVPVGNKSLPYWIGVNSWGRGWGENGTFRIVRGINAGNIEKWVIAGYPEID